MDDYYSDETATFGDRLAAARSDAGLSGDELAKRLGVKSKTIRAWEDDVREPRANHLQMMAGMLNVSLGWLITGVGSGVVAPEEVVPENMQAVLLEMRAIKSEQQQLVERLSRLEKSLRASL